MDIIVKRVNDHLDDIKVKNTKANPNILSELDSTLCSSLTTADAVGLLARIASLLPGLQQDAISLTELAERVAENAPITFEHVLAVVPSDTIQAGLEDGLPASINSVSLTLLKTARSETEVAIVASKEKLVSSLINLWLRTDNIGVGFRAWRVMAHLLGANIDNPSQEQSQTLGAIDTSSHLMWRRLLTDQDTYNLLFSLTSLKTLGQAGQLSRRAKGVSQFRLMDLVITFWPVRSLWTSSLPDTNKIYGLEASQGLIHYCLLHMVDSNDDILERIQLVESYSKFLRTSTWDETLTYPQSKLEFLIEHGIHANILSQFTDPDQSDPLQGLIKSSVIDYVRTYVSCYPQHFVEDNTNTKQRILAHIWKVLESISQNRWARNDDPTGLLGLLSSLPRETFFSGVVSRNPILSLPLRPLNTRTISSLAIIFHGPSRSRKQTTPIAQAESTAARCLFLFYLGANPTFFEDIITTASSVAMPDAASAALDMLLSLATATWSRKESLESSSPLNLPGEETLHSHCTFYGNYPLPPDGVSALLLPPAVNHTMPFLLSSSRHLTGNAYPVAQKKFDVTTAVSRTADAFLAREPTSERNEFEVVAQALKARLQNGILGEGIGVTMTGGVEDVTHSVATMSR